MEHFFLLKQTGLTLPNCGPPERQLAALSDGTDWVILEARDILIALGNASSLEV